MARAGDGVGWTPQLPLDRWRGVCLRSTPVASGGAVAGPRHPWLAVPAGHPGTTCWTLGPCDAAVPIGAPRRPVVAADVAGLGRASSGAMRPRRRGYVLEAR